MTRGQTSVALVAMLGIVFLSGCGPTVFIGDSLLMGQSPQSAAYTPQSYVNNALALANQPAGTFLGGPGAGPCDVTQLAPDRPVPYPTDYVYNAVLKAAPGRVVIAFNGNIGNYFFPSGCTKEVADAGGPRNAYRASLLRMIDEIRRANFTGPIELMNPVPLPRWFADGRWGTDTETGNSALRNVLAGVAGSRTNVTVSDAAFRALSSQSKWTEFLPCDARRSTAGSASRERPPSAT